MPIDILMPALSPTMEKGNLSRWLKKEGDAIKPGDVLAEIETDKATMEVEAVDEGVLAKIVVPAGTEDVPVNNVIGLIAGEGEDATSVAARGASHPSAKGEHKIGQSDQPAPPHLEFVPSPPATPTSGQGAAPRPVASVDGERGPRIFASPLARRIAKDAGLDLAAIKGSGPHGRIIERDVKAARAHTPAAPRVEEARAPSVPAPAPSDEAIRQNYAPGSFEETPHDLMRKTIARRLMEASRTNSAFHAQHRLRSRRSYKSARSDQ